MKLNVRMQNANQAIITPLSVQNLAGGQIRCSPVVSAMIAKALRMYRLLATPPDSTFRKGLTDEHLSIFCSLILIRKSGKEERWSLSSPEWGCSLAAGRLPYRTKWHEECALQDDRLPCAARPLQCHSRMIKVFPFQHLQRQKNALFFSSYTNPKKVFVTFCVGVPSSASCLSIVIIT